MQPTVGAAPNPPVAKGENCVSLTPLPSFSMKEGRTRVPSSFVFSTDNQITATEAAKEAPKEAPKEPAAVAPVSPG